MPSFRNQGEAPPAGAVKPSAQWRGLHCAVPVRRPRRQAPEGVRQAHPLPAPTPMHAAAATPAAPLTQRAAATTRPCWISCPAWASNPPGSTQVSGCRPLRRRVLYAATHLPLPPSGIDRRSPSPPCSAHCAAAGLWLTRPGSSSRTALHRRPGPAAHEPLERTGVNLRRPQPPHAAPVPCVIALELGLAKARAAGRHRGRRQNTLGGSNCSGAMLGTVKGVCQQRRSATPFQWNLPHTWRRRQRRRASFTTKASSKRAHYIFFSCCKPIHSRRTTSARGRQGATLLVVRPKLRVLHPSPPLLESGQALVEARMRQGPQAAG